MHLFIRSKFIFYVKMTRQKQKGEVMTKFSLAILKVLNDNDVGSSGKALSISQILALMPESQRKSYSTMYRHLSNMVHSGYVKCGLDDWLASTYFITKAGQGFYHLQY